MMLARSGIASGTALCVAFAALGAIAAPAAAGFDFADTVTANQAVSSPNVQFNGVSAAAFGTFALPPGKVVPFGSNYVTVSAPAAAGLIPEFATLDFGFPLQESLSFANGDGDYDMVVFLGDIVIDPSGVLVLTTVAFREPGSALFSPSYGINRVLTAGDSQSWLFIDIPEAFIPRVDRDVVQVASLTFVMIGPGTSFGINAVANPEPGTIALFGLGALGLAGLVRRRRKTKIATQTAA